LRLCTSALLLSLLATACMTDEADPADDGGAAHQGRTEFRIDARTLRDANITHVTVEGGGQSQDLVLNYATNTYDGTMLLPAGPQSLVARAFSGPTLVGASNPAGVTVQAGQVLHVDMRILDLTGSAPPVYGPILDSLAFPTTAQVGTPVTFTASVVAPVGDPVTYGWSSTCSDSMFSTPTAATTSWSKAAQGACTITLSATSNGYGISQNFGIVVFPAGSGSGGVDVSASFIAAPSLYFSLPEASCYIGPDGGNSSCYVAMASPSVASYNVNVTSWGGSTPGSLTVSDTCGGHFGTAYNNPENQSGYWLPPVGAGVCILTANAVNGDGIVSTLSAAILVRAGTPATAQPPSIFGQMSPGPFCVFDSNSPMPTDCGAIPAGMQMVLYSGLSWADGHPGSVTLLDDCNGSPTQPSNSYNFTSLWSLPSAPGQICTLTVRGTSLQGSTKEASVRYHLQ
jgi:hypothetical protein